VLENNWQVVWYFDAFDHDGGPPQLDLKRRAVLGEICVPSNPCPFVYLLGKGIAPEGKDWLHANSVYYWPQNGDLVWSSRSQDWVMRVDYNNGIGKGDILWRMGRQGDFTFDNIYSDPWPWFSGQHEVGIEGGGLGPISMMDNGTTRTSDPPLGLGKGTGCQPSDCNSRGMALTIDEANMTVTPVMSVDLGVYAVVFGSAQLLDDGVYFFSPGNSEKKVGGASASYAIQIFPTSNTATGTQELNMQGPKTYRTWEMSSMYAPPIT
jgi:arylsulfate sulfotransferase